MPSLIARLLLVLALLGGAAAAEPDPPARVGRASLVEGDVAYLRDGEWTPLPVNWPITTGTRLSAAPGARAEVRIGSTAVRLSGATEVEFARLDDDATVLRLLQGTIDARVRNPEVARAFSVETPEALATFLEPGRYRFDAGVTPETTAVSADSGTARVETGGNLIVVRAGKRAEVARDGDVRLADTRPDAFDEWAAALDRRAEAARSAHYVSPEMTGYESLDEHGDWREVPAYGAVWVPRAVPVGWAPYRAGRWAWIEPWGWTWVDDAPWGFAPFHYGRWAFSGGIWMWVPGRVVPRPVYAPALVGWIGGPGWSVSVSIGAGPTVGWFPLAPREVYVPAHRHSPAYVRNVNVAHVTNVTHITNVTNVTYANRRIERAVTVVPATAVTRGQPVAHSHVPVRRADLDRHAPVSATPPVAVVAPPPRTAMPRARGDDGPRRRFDPSPRPQDAPRSERRDDRRPDVRTQPAPTTRVTPPGAVEARPAPRQAQRKEAERAETPRTNGPAAPAAPPVQAQPRTEPRTAESRREPRREVQAEPPPRVVAPAPQQQVPPRVEQRREAQRLEPPRSVARPDPSPAQAQPRNEPRAAPPAPVVRTAPPAPSAAPPATQSQPQSMPRGERDRGQGREQRRGEGRDMG